MRAFIHSSRVAATLAVVTLAGANRLAAQTSPRATLQIYAHDSSGAAIPGAELTVLQGLRDVLATGTTDSTGHARIFVDGLTDKTDLEVVMRKIGYVRGDRLFVAAPHDLVLVEITVPRANPTLATVKVTAKVDPKWKSYHIDADEIDNSDAYFTDAWDVVKRLAPDMLTSRGGCATGVQNVWVNGKRIVLPLAPTGMAAARARINIPPRARFGYAPVSVLSDIAPEHIQEINYHDCFDTSMAAVGSDNAIFITLKPGVAYVRDEGSFVLDSVQTRAGGGPPSPQ